MRGASFAAVLALLCHAALAAPAAAQAPITLEGRVVDGATGTPLGGVVVRIPDARLFTLTDHDGTFRFADVEPGRYRVVAMALGFRDHVVEVEVDGLSEIVLRLESRPIELEEIVVVTTSHLDRLATRRANTMNTFWRAFDRDDMADIDDPLEFLDDKAGLVLRPCRGLGADSSLLCLVAPVALQRDLRPTVGLVGRTSGNPARSPNRRMSTLEQMRASSSAYAVWASRPRMGNAYRRVTVYVDDRPIAGSLDGLAQYSLRDIERIETFGMRGERQIRLYTEGYLTMVELGLIRPNFNVPAEDRYVPTWVDDDERDRRRRR